MDYEKKYKSALERAKQFSEKPYLEDSAGIVEYIFPELKKPELAELKDERIMKALIHFFSNDENTSFEYWEGIPKAEVLAWLEKQGQVKESTISQHENKTCKENDDSLTSEDERMRKEICDFICWSTGKGCITREQLERSNCWLVWLEKQGEEAIGYIHTIDKDDNYTIEPILSNSSNIGKDEDKIEPKFKVGDWITNGIETIQITGYDIDYGYQVDYKGNLQHRDTDIIEKEYHLWNINDAKDGDVLACPNDAGDRDVVFIFKNINLDEGWVFCFCASDANGCFCTNNDYVGNSNSTNISPATKEQRNLLFSKMSEAGYEWDAEKKELKKIEQGNSPLLSNSSNNGKNAWSEEDEQYLLVCKNALVKYQTTDKWCANIISRWLEDKLKSLKDRVQPTLAWNENDEVALESAATNYAQDKYLPVQTAQAFKAGAAWQRQQMGSKE